MVLTTSKGHLDFKLKVELCKCCSQSFSWFNSYGKEMVDV